MGIRKSSVDSKISGFGRPHESANSADLKKIHSGKQISKRCGFGEWIHWFRVDGRLIRTKIYAVSKMSGFMWTGPKGNFGKSSLCKGRKCFLSLYLK